jgi:MFS family permease
LYVCIKNACLDAHFSQVSHLDRANIGNAKIEGLEADLGMSGIDYNIAVFIFFVPNILCAIPANLILGKFKRPSTFIGTIICLWGLIVLCGGFVQNLAGLATIRFLIGVFESGFFP